MKTAGKYVAFKITQIRSLLRTLPDHGTLISERALPHQFLVACLPTLYFESS